MIQIIFGLPRSGKSTLLSAVAQKSLENKPLKIGGVSFGDGVPRETVYSTFPCSGCLKIDFDDLGNYNFHDCLIIIDEVSLLADSRNFKTFGENLKYFFAVHCSHNNVFVLLASQSYMDCDVKIRRMATDYFFVKKSILNFSKIVKINQYLSVENGNIIEGYQPEKHLIKGLFNRKKYYSNFDSFSSRKLPDYPCNNW